MARPGHDGCAEHGRLRRNALLRGASTVPLPADVLRLGAEGYLGERRTRREALIGGVGLAIGVAALRRLDPRDLVLRAAEAEAAAPNAPILVSIFLDGGNDGLNTLVPRASAGDPIATADRAIYELYRPRLGLADPSLLAVTGDHAAILGWNPHAAGLKALHDAGRLSIFPATDYPRPDYSHFHSGHFWRTGVLDRSYAVQTGWLGRYLDLVGSNTSPLQGVTIDWSSDEILIARNVPTAVVHAPEDFAVSSPDVRDPGRLMATLAGLGGPATTPGYRQARQQARQTYRTWKALEPLAGTPDDPVPTPYPESSELGSGLRNLARMLGAGLGIRVATISQTGYDTHDGQDERHPVLLEELGASLQAWQDDIEARGLGGRVLTLIWSEFGRRIADNDSFGTDHGAGGLVMLLGNGLDVGIHAQEWGLAGYDDVNGNVPVQTDFRDVYAGVLASHLGVDPAAVLSTAGYSYTGTPVQVFA